MKYLETKTSHNIIIERVIELFGIVSLGYLFFIIIYGHVGFIFNQTITKFTLPISFALYSLLVCIVTVFLKQFTKDKKYYLVALTVFVLFSISMFFLSMKYFSRTYDTSWDGQGYHSNGIISFARGWNPVYEKELPLKFPDASIFVKGYPKALWLIQSSIYLTTGSINAGKVTNLVALIIAVAFSYTFLRKLKIPIPTTLFLTTLLVFQPPFLMQFFSFSADGFSYELFVIAIASLVIFALNTKVNESLVAFTVAELILAGTKFSNLPIVVALGSIFLLNFFRKSINRALVIILTVGGLIFIFVPYATNGIFYKDLFYPTNLKAISDSYKNDNIPKNLSNSNKLTLFFYGVFSQSQVKSMGRDDPLNKAGLKIPFTFTKEEIINSASIFNNRVGSAGSLFSGIVVLSIVTGMLMCYLGLRNIEMRKGLLIMVGAVGICLTVTLLNPVPNLIRYNSQIVLIPFVVVITALIGFKNSTFIRILAYLMLIFIFFNMSIYSGSVLERKMKETIEINKQLNLMKQSQSSYMVKANNFYSNYIRLQEYQIPFEITDHLKCSNQEILLNSSYTTRFCKK